MDISGTWQGEYSYEENADAPRVAGQVVNFTMELKRGWLGMLSGTVRDDPRTGFPEAGKVSGKAKGLSVLFSRQMPLMRLVHEAGSISLEKWSERHKLVMDTEKAHPPIRFLGELSADGQTMQGTWRSAEVKIEVPGSVQIVYIPVLYGSWHARRAAAGNK